MFEQNCRDAGDFFKMIFGEVETKKDVTNLYIQGIISKDEFIRRMKDARD